MGLRIKDIISNEMILLKAINKYGRRRNVFYFVFSENSWFDGNSFQDLLFLANVV